LAREDRNGPIEMDLIRELEGDMTRQYLKKGRFVV